MALMLSIGCRDGLANTQGFTELFSGGLLKIFTGGSPGVEYGVIGSELVSGTVTCTSSGTGAISIRFSATVGQTGTAGYFRLSNSVSDPYVNSNGTAIHADGTCGVVDGFCELLFSDLAMTAGNNITILGYLRIPSP